MLLLSAFVHVGVCAHMSECVAVCMQLFSPLKQRRCQGELAPLRLNAQRA